MARPLALRAEIFDCLNQAGAKIHLPEAVHDDAGRQRIGRVDQPRARASRLFAVPQGAAAATAGTPGSPSRPADRMRRASEERLARSWPLLHDHHSRKTLQHALLLLAQLYRLPPGVAHRWRSVPFQEIKRDFIGSGLTALRGREFRDRIDRTIGGQHSSYVGVSATL